MLLCKKHTCFYSYSNLEKIKSEAVWNDESQCWRLPELVITRTKLPPAGMSVSELLFIVLKLTCKSAVSSLAKYNTTPVLSCIVATSSYSYCKIVTD
jgi:hypothetical protein